MSHIPLKRDAQIDEVSIHADIRKIFARMIQVFENCMSRLPEGNSTGGFFYASAENGHPVRCPRLKDLQRDASNHQALWFEREFQKIDAQITELSDLFTRCSGNMADYAPHIEVSIAVKKPQSSFGLHVDGVPIVLNEMSFDPNCALVARQFARHAGLSLEGRSTRWLISNYALSSHPITLSAPSQQLALARYYALSGMTFANAKAADEEPAPAQTQDQS